ncbi:MAG: two pore domain potassium channel family protein [Coprobacter sp.]|nr:two pore domain potassium channel family protein [Coprobacter sp.]
METAVHELVSQKKGLYGFLHILVLALSLFLIITISIDTFKNVPFYTQPIFMKIQFWICIVFLLDFFIEFFLAKQKGRFFASHFIFLLVSIPYHQLVAWLGCPLSQDMEYIFRFIPLIRGGYALTIVISWFTFSRATNLFVTYLITLLSMIYFGSLAFFTIEQGVNQLVNNYSDALWWAFMDVTTVGSNIIAVTAIGRILSVLLAALGMMMFPIFTVYITNLIEKRNKEKETYYKTHPDTVVYENEPAPGNH